MVFEPQALAPGPGTRGWGHLQVAPISIRFERFPVFHTSTSGGGHDFFTASPLEGEARVGGNIN
jgi:hypothetical protein